MFFMASYPRDIDPEPHFDYIRGLYKSADNPQELAQGLDSVLAEASDFAVDAFEAPAQ